MHAQDNAPGPTRLIADWISAPTSDPPTERALTCARHAFLDWTGVTLAAASDDLANMLVKDTIRHEETGSAGIVGRSEGLTPGYAALVNGAISHALDYDDVNKRMRGHPSVTILPAILAASTGRNFTYGDILDAFITGTEVACIVGEMLGAAHYDRGFHTTATTGTIAAAAAVSRLWKLGSSETETALGLSATQAAGLRTMFGSMGKPIHAGKAAMNGLLAARWASSGISGQKAALEAPEGFGPVLSDGFARYIIRQDKGQPFGIEKNVYKYHAACYYTHSAIEAMRVLLQNTGVKAEAVEHVRVGIQPSLLSVCDIRAPATGLEVKFSIRHLLAMILADISTSDIGQYTDELAIREELVRLRSNIDVDAVDLTSRTSARVELTLRDSSKVAHELDVGIPAENLQTQETSLSRKFHALVDSAAGTSRARNIEEKVLSMSLPEPAEVLTRELYKEAG